MPKKMSREELIDLTESIYTMYNKNTKRFLEEDEHLALIHKFLENINHPAGTDLIFYPELVGLPSNPSVFGCSKPFFAAAAAPFGEILSLLNQQFHKHLD